MISKLYLLGLGPGHPKYLTLEAVKIIKKLDLFFLPDKKEEKEELTKARLNILREIKGEEGYRVVFLPFPERKKGPDYRQAVKEWRNKKAEILKEYLLKEEGEAGFLVWGDPSLYDGHVEVAKQAILSLVSETNNLIELEVIPGISSFQVLAAKFKISLTEIARPLVFHTPRSLRKERSLTNNALVFLDNYTTFMLFAKENPYLYWGAYVGTEKECLIAGRLSDVESLIREKRKEAKSKYGYLMEIYFLKPSLTEDGSL